MLDLIFEKMAKIGWHLDDFKEVLDCHKTTMENVCNDETLEDTDLQYMAQFMLDFTRAVELLDKDTDIIDFAFTMAYYHSDLLYKLMSDDDKLNEYCESKFVQKLCEEYAKGDWDNEDISLADSIKIFLEHKLKEAEDNG